MFLPIGDSPNPRGTPWVNYALIAANVLVYIGLFPMTRQAADPQDPQLTAYLQNLVDEIDPTPTREQLIYLAGQVSRYDLLVFDRGFRPSDPSLIDLFTAMFLHGGFMHLAGNMLFLWIYGDNVEFRLGRFGYLLVYVATGVAAGLGDWALRVGSGIPSVGASGAISGVLGLYFLWFPRNRVRVWVFLFPIFARVIEMPARIVLGIYLIFDNILPAILASGSGGVSHGAHIGGFIAGGALAFALNRLTIARPEGDVRHVRAEVRAPAPGDAAGAFREALGAGRWQTAAGIFFDTPHGITRHQINMMDKIRLGEMLESNRHPKAALRAFQRALADHSHGEDRPRAHLGAARVLMYAMGFPAAAYQHLYSALEAQPSAAETNEARRLLDELSSRVRSMPRR